MTAAAPRSVRPEEVARIAASGRSIDLIDVRTPPEFAAAHARGAAPCPLSDLDPHLVLRRRSAAPGEPIYVLCKSGGRATKAAQAFISAGFDNVCVIEGGTDGWQAAGLPMNYGRTTVISLERQVRIAAGSIVLLGLALALLVHPYFLGLSAFVGAGLVFAGITDTCGMGMLLARLPWNTKCNQDTCNPKGVH